MKKYLLLTLSLFTLTLCSHTVTAQEIATSDTNTAITYSLDNDYSLLAMSATTSSSLFADDAGDSSSSPSSPKKKGFNSPKTNDIWGLTAGYVSKLWSREYPSGEVVNQGLNNDAWLHGIQFGIRINPQFKYGFGIDAGIFYEYFHNRSAQLTGTLDGAEIKYFRTLNEHSLRIPVHLEYRLNFSKEFQLFFYGGAAASYVLSGNMSYTQQGYQAPYLIENDIYGPIIPSAKRYNVAASFGGGFRFGIMQFNIGSELGLINVSPSEEYILKQNKPLQVMLSIMF